MGKTQRQKELLAQYKEKRVVGGICSVLCIANGKKLLLPAADPESQRSRFRFAVSTSTPLLPAMAADWQVHGPGSFTFEMLEELEKGPSQTDQEFLADLKALSQLWRERLGGEFYV